MIPHKLKVKVIFLRVYNLYSGKPEDGKHKNTNQFTINTFSDYSNDDSSITSDSSTGD